MERGQTNLARATWSLVNGVLCLQVLGPHLRVRSMARLADELHTTFCERRSHAKSQAHATPTVLRVLLSWKSSTGPVLRSLTVIAMQYVSHRRRSQMAGRSSNPPRRIYCVLRSILYRILGSQKKARWKPV